jgi:hypothetical protein
MLLTPAPINCFPSKEVIPADRHSCRDLAKVETEGCVLQDDRGDTLERQKTLTLFPPIVPPWGTILNTVLS